MHYFIHFYSLFIICALIVILLTKIIPYYLIKDKEISDKDIYYSLMVFILYLFYVQIMSGNLISKFNEIYYENLILGKKTPIPLFILSKIIEIRNKKKRKM